MPEIRNIADTESKTFSSSLDFEKKAIAKKPDPFEKLAKAGAIACAALAAFGNAAAQFADQDEYSNVDHFLYGTEVPVLAGVPFKKKLLIAKEKLPSDVRPGLSIRVRKQFHFNTNTLDEEQEIPTAVYMIVGQSTKPTGMGAFKRFWVLKRIYIHEK